jgi:hypothetical protein
MSEISRLHEVPMGALSATVYVSDYFACPTIVPTPASPSGDSAPRRGLQQPADASQTAGLGTIFASQGERMMATPDARGPRRLGSMLKNALRAPYRR